MEPKHIPLVIPIWITGKVPLIQHVQSNPTFLTPPGFDQIMPEKRKFPRFIPRLRKHISITIGDPIKLHQRLHDVLGKDFKTRAPQIWDELEKGDQKKLGEMGLRESPTRGGSGGIQSKGSPPTTTEEGVSLVGVDNPEKAHMRSLLSACIREELVRVGEYREHRTRGMTP